MLRRYFVLKNVWVFDNGRVLIYSDGRCDVNHPVCTAMGGRAYDEPAVRWRKIWSLRMRAGKKALWERRRRSAPLRRRSAVWECVCVCVSVVRYTFFSNRGGRDALPTKSTHTAAAHKSSVVFGCFFALLFSLFVRFLVPWPAVKCRPCSRHHHHYWYYYHLLHYHHPVCAYVYFFPGF